MMARLARIAIVNARQHVTLCGNARKFLLVSEEATARPLRPRRGGRAIALGLGEGGSPPILLWLFSLRFFSARFSAAHNLRGPIFSAKLQTPDECRTWPPLDPFQGLRLFHGRRVFRHDLRIPPRNAIR